MEKKVKQALDNYEAASRAVMDAVQQAYPIGLRMEVKLGGHNIFIEVTAHSSSWWHQPAEIIGVNVSTGKLRRFHPSQIR